MPSNSKAIQLINNVISKKRDERMNINIRIKKVNKSMYQ